MMGLGGMLTWTAAIREIHNYYGKKVFPCEFDGNGNYVKSVESEIFLNNPYCYNGRDDEERVYLPTNIPETNYCKEDYPDRCVQRPDKHIIEQICEYHGIMNPELRCDLFFSDKEVDDVESLLADVSGDFLVIEPLSNDEYTVNKKYPFDKWQTVVNTLSRDIEIVQIGTKEKHLLNNVTNMIGKTTFREAACLIGYSDLLMCTEGGLVHAATTVDTPALSIITGFLDPRLVSYPQNTNVYIGTHGPCGWKIPCEECQKDVANHDENDIVSIVKEFLGENGIY